MRRIITLFCFLICFLFQDCFVVNATNPVSSQCCCVKKKSSQRKLKRLARIKARKSKRNKAKAIRIAKKNGWFIRKVKGDGSVIELVGIDKQGRPVYKTTHKVN